MPICDLHKFALSAYCKAYDCAQDTASHHMQGWEVGPCYLILIYLLKLQDWGERYETGDSICTVGPLVSVAHRIL